MKAARIGCGLGLISLAGAGVSFIVSVWLFTALLWGFPENWKPLNGLPADRPQALLALDAGQEKFLLSMANGDLYTCVKQDCQPEPDDWRANFACDAAQKPALIGYLPFFLFKNFQPLLACERSHLDVARTVVVTQVDGTAWVGGGVGMLPTDASAVAAGILGAAAGLIGTLLLGSAILLVRAIVTRKAHTPK